MGSEVACGDRTRTLQATRIGRKEDGVDSEASTWAQMDLGGGIRAGEMEMPDSFQTRARQTHTHTRSLAHSQRERQARHTWSSDLRPLHDDMGFFERAWVGGLVITTSSRHNPGSDHGPCASPGPGHRSPRPAASGPNAVRVGVVGSGSRFFQIYFHLCCGFGTASSLRNCVAERSSYNFFVTTL